MENIQSITMELRPRLQSCNAFIRLNDNMQPHQMQVKLLDECITLMMADDTVNLFLNVIKIIPSSISAFRITNNWLTFRVQTKSDPSFGSIRREVVANCMPTPSFRNDTFNKKEFFIGSNCIIICSCCQNLISDTVSFARVLPLPDIDYDLSEWYCCKHTSDNVTIDLSPQKSDFLYGPYFSVLNCSLFNHNVRLDNNTLLCKRCLQYLGRHHDRHSYKLWDSSVEYQSTDCSVLQAASKPLSDFFKAFQSSLTCLFGEEIILQYTANKENHYLLIKPMDWHLNLFTEPSNVSDSKDIYLQRLSVVKVLYKYATNESNIASVSLTAKICDVSLRVIEAGLKYLLSSTKRYPEAHRGAAGFYIGHIQLDQIPNITCS